MSDCVFFYKDLRVKNDRDAVKYLELKEGKIESLRLTGPCFSTSLSSEKPEYPYIDTILTKGEFEILIAVSQRKRACDDTVRAIFDKLLSEENKQFTEEIMDIEREYLCEEFSLTDNELDDIFDAYPYDYRDRAIISVIFDDVYEAGYEEAWNMGYVTKDNERWFNYEAFGEDLLDWEGYYQMEDGRVVYFMF